MKVRFGERGRVHVLTWADGYARTLCGSDAMSLEFPKETDEPVTCKRCKAMSEEAA